MRAALSCVVNYVEPFAGSLAMLLGCPAWPGETARAPFPYFGGKMRAVEIVWARFGAARLPQVFTINDLNCYVANFWRAVAWDPEGVARWADWPVNECDLHARHRWLLKAAGWLRTRLDADPMFYDARVAGWWVWGASAWIGSGWCEEGRTPVIQLPAVGTREHGNGGGTDQGRGVHGKRTREPSRRLPDLAGGTQWGTSEANVRAGRGVHSQAARTPTRQLPYLGGSVDTGGPTPNMGRGLNAQGMREPSRQLPDLGGGSGDSPGVGRGMHNAANRTRLYDIFDELSRRLRHVRVACGDWQRICTDSVTHRHGMTAVFLDPPYEDFECVYGMAKRRRGRRWTLCELERFDRIGKAFQMRAEACGMGPSLSVRVRAWCLEAGKRVDMRVALCGYEGEHDELEAVGWEVVAWKAKGGFANQGAAAGVNAKRERIWFSPACLRHGVSIGQIALPGLG